MSQGFKDLSDLSGNVVNAMLCNEDVPLGNAKYEGENKCNQCNYVSSIVGNLR